MAAVLRPAGSLDMLPYFGWLHVGPATLTEHAAAAVWQCEVIRAEENGDYLAALTP
jgi:hypothetical protein